MQTYYEIIDTSIAKKFLQCELDNLNIPKDVFNNIIFPYLDDNCNDNENNKNNNDNKNNKNNNNNNIFYKEIHSFKVSPRHIGYELNNRLHYYFSGKLLICAKRIVWFLSIFTTIIFGIAQIIYNVLMLLWCSIFILLYLVYLLFLISGYIIWIIFYVIIFIFLITYYILKYISCMEINLNDFKNTFMKFTTINNLETIIDRIVKKVAKRPVYCHIGKICNNKKYWYLYYNPEPRGHYYQEDGIQVFNNSDRYRFNRNICQDFAEFLLYYGLSHKHIYHTPSTGPRYLQYKGDYQLTHSRDYAFHDVKYLYKNPNKNNHINISNSQQPNNITISNSQQDIRINIMYE